jgi:hypothetical protein
MEPDLAVGKLGKLAVTQYQPFILIYPTFSRSSPSYYLSTNAYLNKMSYGKRPPFMISDSQGSEKLADTNLVFTAFFFYFWNTTKF